MSDASSIMITTSINDASPIMITSIDDALIPSIDDDATIMNISLMLLL